MGKVIFDKQAGVNYTKGKKRMRGGVNSLAPEVKKWNCWHGSGNGYTSLDFVNNLTGGDASTCTSYNPRRINWPTMGTGGDNRVGNRIMLRAIRFKGWITVAPDQLMSIRWRLVLCRLDLPEGTLTFDTAAYLNQFKNSDVNKPTVWDQAAWNSFSRHNFYKKFKDVENKAFKSKVIASGVLPPTNTYQKLNLILAGTIGGQNAGLSTVGQSASYIVGSRGNLFGYLPIDVTVAINDNVDCYANLRRYYVVLETDIGYGWTDVGAPSSTEIGLLINMFARGYYTDA